MSFTCFTISRRYLLLADVSLGGVIFLLFSIFKAHADWVLIGAWFTILLYIMLSGRYKTLVHMFLSTVIATIWMQCAVGYYDYSYDFLVIFGLNTMPLMAWSISLLGLGETCNNFNLPGKRYKFLLFVLVFWVMLIAAETFAYHVLEIRNRMTASYEGLPYCDCIHAPGWMKVIYFAMGPAYFGLTILADYMLDLCSGWKNKAK